MRRWVAVTLYSSRFVPVMARRDSRLTAAIGSLQPLPGATGYRPTPAIRADGSDAVAYGDVRSRRYVVVGASPQTGANEP
jgi:hypothetical protein